MIFCQFHRYRFAHGTECIYVKPLDGLSPKYYGVTEFAYYPHIDLPMGQMHGPYDGTMWTCSNFPTVALAMACPVWSMIWHTLLFSDRFI